MNGGLIMVRRCNSLTFRVIDRIINWSWWCRRSRESINLANNIALNAEHQPLPRSPVKRHHTSIPCHFEIAILCGIIVWQPVMWSLFISSNARECAAGFDSRDRSCCQPQYRTRVAHAIFADASAAITLSLCVWHILDEGNELNDFAVAVPVGTIYWAGRFTHRWHIFAKMRSTAKLIGFIRQISFVITSSVFISSAACAEQL